MELLGTERGCSVPGERKNRFPGTENGLGMPGKE